MLIYLLRHGETQYNAEKRYQGTLDIPLSPKGLAELCRADISPKTVFVSPLCRARQTADVLFPDALQQVVEDLREMCFGSFQGRNYVDMERDPDYRMWVGEDCKGRCPGGESRDEFSQRSCGVFCTLVDQALQRGEEQLVIMAHGGTQMAVMEQFALPKRPYHEWCGPNAGGYLLETNAEQWRDHLVQLRSTVQYRKEEQPC